MSAEPTHSKHYPLPWNRSSHRTWPEQAVGAAIFLLVSLAFAWLLGSLIQSASEASWAGRSWASYAVSRLPWTLYHCLVAFAMWNLWRRYSLTLLKIELAVFLCQLVLGAGWAALFFAFHEPLLALTALLFQCIATVLAALLYWKKNRLSGQVLTLPFLWIFFVCGINMAMCISNP